MNVDDSGALYVHIHVTHPGQLLPTNHTLMRRPFLHFEIDSQTLRGPGQRKNVEGIG